MRKLYVVLWTVAFFGILASMRVSAATVNDARWVTRNDAPIPYVRIVLDLSSPVSATADIDESGRYTTVTLKNSVLGTGAPTSLTMDASIASTAKLAANGKHLTVSISTPSALEESDVKVFSIKKDEANNKPYRLVIDIRKKGVAPRDDYYGSAKSKERVAQANAKTETKKSSGTKTATKKNVPPPYTDYRTSGGLSGKRIVIDPGHGGSDPGAIGPKGTMEKNVTLPISNYLADELKKRGATAILTRTGDKDVYGPYASGPDELQARVDVANTGKADVFISVHINAFTNPTVGGIATFYYAKTKYDSKLALRMQEQIAKVPGFGGDRGAQPGNLYVLRSAGMPAVLVELGFLSNPGEESQLAKDSVLKEFARRMADALERYFEG